MLFDPLADHFALDNKEFLAVAKTDIIVSAFSPMIVASGALQAPCG
jgi:hypothetical protein